MKTEGGYEDHEPNKFNKSSGSKRHQYEREESTAVTDARSLREKLQSTANSKEQQLSSSDYGVNYKRNSNKKAFKGNWTTEEVSLA